MMPSTPGGCTLAAVIGGVLLSSVLAVLALVLIPVGGTVDLFPASGPEPAVSSVTASALVTDLENAEALWKTSGVDSYRIQVRIGGAWWLNTYTITVRNGLIADVAVQCDPGMVGLTNCPDDPAAAAEDFTVPALFTGAHRFVDSGDAAWFTASFDPTYGYPASMRFDHPDMLDEEWFITVLSFEMLPE